MDVRESNHAQIVDFVGLSANIPFLANLYLPWSILTEIFCSELLVRVCVANVGRLAAIRFSWGVSGARKKNLRLMGECVVFLLMSIVEIEKMTTPERLRAMEALWDALCHEKSEPESPKWHGDVLAKRRQKIDSGEATFISIEEAKRRLQ